jgi:sigma-E factor negative regulatory protein RseB
MNPLSAVRWLGFRALAVGVVAAAFAPCPAVAGAEGAAAAASSSSAGADARSWLQRIHGAASQRNYQGTLVVTTNGTVSSSRIAHYCEGAQSFERIDVLDGHPQRIYRHNDQVVTVWPASKQARIEQRDPVALFPAVLSGTEDQLFDRYEMLREGNDRIAGLDATVFLLRPRDANRFAQRLWADRASGLLLRADVLSPEGRVLETAAFSEVTIGVRSQPETVLAPMKKLDGYQVVRANPQKTALEAEGWRLKAPVAGFKQINCVKRSLDLSSDGDRTGASDVLQAIFSDGLTHVSVFIEPYRPERHRAGSAAVGATFTLMQAVGPNWVTVMGDVPLGTLKQFAAALERQR